MPVQTAGLNMLLDPVWSKRVSPFRFVGPKRVNDPGIAFADLPPIDVVLVSHGHYDHLDLATLSRLAAAHRPRFVTPLGNDTIMRNHDPAIATEAYDWEDSGKYRRGEWSSRWSPHGTGRRETYLTETCRCGPRS
jgi:L-ascorbate metabolism protein UlaG (beta-lactamase superfamily)